MTDFLGKFLDYGSGYFWRREVWHFGGGVLIGLFTTLFQWYWVTFAVFATMLAVLVQKEIREDMVSQTRIKTVVDLIAWVVGFWAVAWTKLV